VLGYAVCYLVHQRIKRIESENGYELTDMVKDPYQIAFLRGGAVEALQVATIVLIDRGLLRLNDGDNTMETVSADSLRYVRHEIERDVLKLYLKRQGRTFELGNHAESMPSCRAYAALLAEHELLAGPPVRRRRAILVGWAWLVLLGIAAVKAAVAIATGHYNLIFLALLSVCFYFYLRAQRDRPETWSTINLLADLRILFERLSVRCKRLNSGDGSGDLALLAAIFGIGALPFLSYPYVLDLYPVYRPLADSKADGGASSGGDGAGGGGDGGGGGCGGCGGCGGG
jgi:uncharacterized protein (TIGR04222 family)